MTRFTVDIEELGELARSALGLYSTLDGQQIPKGALEGAAGDRRVAHEYDAFVGNWSNGLEKIRGHLSELVDALSAARHAYSDTEGKITAAAGGSGGGGSMTAGGQRAGGGGGGGGGW